MCLLTAHAQKHEYEIKVGEFNTLQVVDNANVVWRCLPDSAGYIQFYGEERFADSSFLTEVKSNSALSVSAESVPPAADFKVTLIGNGRIDAGGLRCTRVSAKIATGNGVVTLGGECHDASFAMLGTGQIRADELEAQDVSCSIMGTGSIYTWPVEKLSTKGIGSTTIYYRGTPGEIRKRGGGKLVQLEGAAAGVSPGAPSRHGVATRRPVTEEAVEEEIPDEEVIEEGVEEEEEPVTLPVRRN